MCFFLPSLASREGPKSPEGLNLRAIGGFQRFLVNFVDFDRFHRSSSIPLRPCNKWINSVRISMEDMDQLPGASDSDRSQFGERRDWMCMRDVLFDFIYREKDVFVVETDVFLSFCWCNMFFPIHNRRITLSILPFYLVFVPVAELPHTWCRTGLLLECSIESSKAVRWGKVFRHWAESMFNSDNFKTWLMVHKDLSNILIPCRIDYLASSVGHTWHFVTLIKWGPWEIVWEAWDIEEEAVKIGFAHGISVLLAWSSQCVLQEVYQESKSIKLKICKVWWTMTNCRMACCQCWSENPPGRCPHPLRWTCASKPHLVDAFVHCAAVFFVIPSLADPTLRHPPNQRVSVRAATLWQRLRSISQVGRRIVIEYFRCYRKIGEHLFGVGNATCNAMLVGSTWKVCGFTSCSSVMEVPVSTARFQKHNLLSQVFVQ